MVPPNAIILISFPFQTIAVGISEELMFRGYMQENLKEFDKNSDKSGKNNILVSSDLSARGLDIPEVTHIINLDFPGSANEYIHRAGRTARGNGS